jgi:hypothetical protein
MIISHMSHHSPRVLGFAKEDKSGFIVFHTSQHSQPETLRQVNLWSFHADRFEDGKRG